MVGCYPTALFIGVDLAKAPGHDKPRVTDPVTLLPETCCSRTYLEVKNGTVLGTSILKDPSLDVSMHDRTRLRPYNSI